MTSGKKFRLKDVRSRRHGRLTSEDKPQAKEGAAGRGTERCPSCKKGALRAGPVGSVLIFQAMDAAGKDGTIKHVMSGVNPQGCQVYSFKAPSTRGTRPRLSVALLKRLPERGRIGIFNRSYYEEVLVVRVHPEISREQKLPPQLVGKDDLGRALRGHPQLRALSQPQRHRSS